MLRTRATSQIRQADRRPAGLYIKAGSEEHVMQVAVENQQPASQFCGSQTAGYTAVGCCCPVARSLLPLLRFGRMPWLGKLQRSGRGTGPRLQAKGCSGGRCRLHVSFCGYGYTCLSSWMNLGNDMFRMDNSRPIFVPTQDISSLCVHRPEGDDALVIPLKGPL